MEITKAEMLGLVDEINEPAGLTEYAARAAAEMLAENWEASIRDNYPGSFIENDISQIDELLQKFGAAIRFRMKAVPAEA
jgi:hypothetical protein